jgi:ubiquinone/menaquinone biosynthesis C-methylase UbiE
MDDPAADPAEVRGALAYLRWVNRALRYNHATRQRVAAWARSWSPTTPITLLDVATGSGDVPTYLLRQFPAFPLKFVGVDLHEVTVAEANRSFPAARADATCLPFADGSIDYVLSSMFLHHLSHEQAMQVLREIWRVARRGVLVADQIRSRRALGWIRLLTLHANAMVRHDAVVSVRQAFTMDEIAAMAREAGWRDIDLRRHFAHRFTVVASKPQST